MSSIAPAGSPRGPSSPGRARSPLTTVLLVVVAMVVLFGAGFGVSRLLGGRSDSGGTAGPSVTPCTTTTVVPGAGLPKPAKVTVNVYNSTDRAGLARKTAAALKARGFVIGTVANDPKGQTVAATAEIRYGPKGLANATLLAVYIPASVLVDDGRATSDVDAALGTAYTGLASPAAVKASLTKPSPSVSPPGCGTTPKPTTSASGASPAASS